MGLDAYLYAVPEYAVVDAEARVDHQPRRPKANPHEFGYWRKDWPLQNHMAMLYKERGGTDPDFNLSTLTLRKSDLDNLRILFPEDKETWDRAWSYIDDGYFVYYQSWY